MIASIVVNFRTAQFVEQLLASGELSGTRVFIVDNGSEPGPIAELCERHGAQAVLLPINIGFAGGVNRALQQLPPELSEVLLVNPDVTLSVGAVAQLLGALNALEADAVCPLLLVAGTRAVQGGNGGGPLTLTSVALYYWFGARLFKKAHGLFLNRPQVRLLTTPARLDWLSMACILIRRDAFSRYGLLPEEEFMYGEDVAWGTRASSEGAQFFLVPSVAVEHVGGASGSGGFATHVGSVCRLAKRRMPGWRSKAACFIVWSGLRLRQLVGLRV